MLPFARQRGMMTNVAALMGGAPAPPSGFVALASNAVTLPASTTITATSSQSLAAGAVAVAAVWCRGAAVSNFRDSVDAATAWTAIGTNYSVDNLKLFKRVVPAGGFDASTVFTATIGASGVDGGGLIVAGFTDATAIPTTTDGDGTTSGTSTSLTVAGPSVGTSYQYAAIFASSHGTSGPDAGSDASWHFDRAGSETNAGSGIRTYWRKASGTGSTTLKETEGGFSGVVYAWIEAAL